MEKASRIGEILDELYPEVPIPLDHVDPYTLLVAVALSAHLGDFALEAHRHAQFIHEPLQADGNVVETTIDVP